MNLYEYNSRFRNFGCPKCGAYKGDPCRTPAWKTTQPHRERVALLWKQKRSHDIWGEKVNHVLSDAAFDANDGKPHLRTPLRPKLAVPLELARRFAEDSFHAGTLAALDVVFLHDQPTIAAEIVNATDHKALLRHAVREQYYNLKNLKFAIRDATRRRRIQSSGDNSSS